MTTYYCSTTDIKNYVSNATLIQLTDDDCKNEINFTVTREAILYSSTLIDGYLRGRYTLPLDTHFPLLKMLALDISVYRLYSRRMRNEIPEVIEKNYEIAISTLKDIQKGVITLQSENDLLETSDFNTTKYRTNKNILDKLFGKQRMSEY